MSRLGVTAAVWTLFAVCALLRVADSDWYGRAKRQTHADNEELVEASSYESLKIWLAEELLKNKLEAVSLVEGVRNVTVIDNRTYLWCRFSGTPPPKIVWFKDGRPLRRRMTVHETPGTSALLIQPVYQSDSGNYTCSAQQGSLTPVNSSAQLRVLSDSPQLSTEYPQVTCDTDRKTFEITSVVHIGCTVRSARSKPIVTWFRNKVPIAINEARYSVGVGGASPEDFTLRISNAAENDTGDYECVAWTPGEGYQAVSSSASIFVKTRQVAPRITNISSNSEVRSGSNLQVYCSAIGFPMPSVRWEERGRTISNSLPDPRNPGYSSATLVNLRNAKNLTCVANSTLGIVSLTVTIFVVEEPLAPTSLETLGIDSTSIRIRWAPAPRPTTVGVQLARWRVFGVRYRKKSAPSFSEVENITQTEFLATGLTPFTEYEFLVLARNEMGFSAPSSPLTAMTTEAPPYDAPSQVVAKAVNRSAIELSWRPPTLPNGIITNYVVSYVRVNESSPLVVPPIAEWQRVELRNASTRVVLGRLVHNQTYRIVLNAQNKAGDGPATEQILVVTDPSVPQAPRRLIGQVLGPSSVSLVWDAPANNWVNISAFEIFYNDSETSARVQSAAMHKILDDLYPATLYSFYVSALSQQGRSPPSNMITLQTFDYMPAASPSNLQATQIGERYLLLRWDPVAKRDRNGVLTGYRLSYVVDSPQFAALATAGRSVRELLRTCTNVTIMNASVLNYNLTDLSPWTTYRIWIFALNGRGESPLNRSASIVLTTAESVPGRPTDVSCTPANSTAIRVTWQSPSEGERNGIIGSYTVLFWEKADQGSIWTASVSALESNRSGPRVRYDHVLSSLQPATTYEMVVKAITRRGDGERSVAVTCRTLAATPDPPTDLIVRTSSEPLIVSASWSPPANIYGNLTRYRLSYMRKERNNGFMNVLASETTLDIPPDQTTHWLPSSSFLFGATYEFSLRATNLNGDSRPAFTRVTMPERRPAAPPSNVTVCALNESSAEVRWDPIAARDQNGLIVLYEVMYLRLDRQSAETNANTTERRLAVHRLKPGTSYRFNLRAFNSAGGSDWSETQIFQFGGVRPQPPRILYVNRSSVQPRSLEIRLAFSAHSIPVTNFKVYFTSDDSLPFPSHWLVREVPPTTFLQLDGVEPAGVYSVRITSVGVDCLESTYSALARESPTTGSASDRLGEVRALFVNSTSVRLSWPLAVCAGALGDSNTFFTVRYNLRIRRGLPVSSETLDREYEQNETSNWVVLDRLEPFSTYDVSVFAPLLPCSVQHPLTLTVQTNASAPPPPERPIVADRVPPNAFNLRIAPASNENGLVTRYWIVVVPQRDGVFESIGDACNRSFNSLQVGNSVFDYSRPFLAASFSSFRWPSKGDVVIGGTQRSELNDEPISSMSLQQSIVYCAFLKAIVDTTRFSCSPCSDAFVVDAAYSGLTSGESVASAAVTRIDDLILIVSPICAFLALSLIVVVVVAVVLSRRKQPRRPYADGGPKNGSAVYLPLQVNTTKRSDMTSLTQPLLGAQTGSPTNQASFVQAAIGCSPNGNGFGGSSNSSATGFTMSASNTLRHATGSVGAHTNPLLQQAAVFAAAQRLAHSPPRGSERSFALTHTDVPDPVELRRINMPTAALMNHPPIALETFGDHVERLRANDNLKFSQEYESIDPGQQFTWEQSNADANKSKNRYANVVAYDHSRVVLHAGADAAPGSDYINANYVDGYRRPNAYIATQGPLADTVADFWYMTWQERCTLIVMMTKLEERTRVKCDQYWPCKGTDTYDGRVHVTLLDVQEFAYYVIRTFAVQLVGSEEKRELRQLQFTAWPDHGVPEHPAPLLMFIRRVRSYYTPEMGPVVVHCSAGVGRTGAFIVIDSSLERIRYERTLDIYGHVTCLRAQRNYMVQTEDQYVFIHDALLEALESSLGITEVSARSLFSHIQKLRQPVLLGTAFDTASASASASTASPGGVTTTGMEAEFRRLNMFKPNPSRFVSANATVNRFKNRLVNILPYESSRVALQPIRGVEGSDYINASFVDSYRRQRGYVATQGPLAETTDDFWRMLWETGSTIVVMLTKLRELSREKCHQYWPADRSTRYQYFVVDPTAEYSMPQYVLREFKMTDARDGSSRTIRQFQYIEWPEQGVPKSGEGFIDFIGQVHKTKEQFGQDGPITVHCSAGVGRTGVFIALSIILERLRYEGVVDVLQTVRMLRTQRPAMVQTEEQYQFCYSAALEYLGSFDHYAT